MINSSLDDQLRAYITKRIRTEFEAESAKHEPSGKLSAGQLGKPLLEQVLKVIGVPTKDVDDYALGLFRRGDSVEDEIMDLLQPDETQKEVVYKDCIGIVDAIKDDQVYEVKSIKNSAVCYIDPENHKRIRRGGELVAQYGGVKWAHALQGALYALALNKDHFTIIYVAADDLRTYPHIIATEELKADVDQIITQVKHQLALGVLPEWQPREDWQAKPENLQYSNYPAWINMDVATMMTKLRNQYPDAYTKLTKGTSKK